MKLSHFTLSAVPLFTETSLFVTFLYFLHVRNVLAITYLIVCNNIPQPTCRVQSNLQSHRKHKVGWNDDSEMVSQFFWFFINYPKII